MNQKKAIRNERTNEMKLAILNDAYNDSVLISDMYLKHVANDRNTPNNVITFNGNFFKKQIDISLWNLTEFISQNYLNGNL